MPNPLHASTSFNNTKIVFRMQIPSFFNFPGFESPRVFFSPGYVEDKQSKLGWGCSFFQVAHMVDAMQHVSSM